MVDLTLDSAFETIAVERILRRLEYRQRSIRIVSRSPAFAFHSLCLLLFGDDFAEPIDAPIIDDVTAVSVNDFKREVGVWDQKLKRFHQSQSALIDALNA